MASLIYFVGRDRQELPLKAPETTIGRTKECVLSLPHDLEVSRTHCTVVARDSDTYVLIDHNARNGTFLNGERVASEEKPLVDGDEIRVGQTVIMFSDPVGGHTTEIFTEVAREMEKGKGYHTIMRNIILQPPGGKKAD